MLKSRYSTFVFMPFHVSISCHRLHAGWKKRVCHTKIVWVGTAWPCPSYLSRKTKTKRLMQLMLITNQRREHRFWVRHILCKRKPFWDIVPTLRHTASRPGNPLVCDVILGKSMAILPATSLTWKYIEKLAGKTPSNSGKQAVTWRPPCSRQT